MTLREKQSVFALNVSKLIAFAYGQGYELTMGEVLRTEAQQMIYVNMGRSKTVNSKHLQKLAIDLNLFKDGKILTMPAEYKPLGEYWVTLNSENRWGGDWDKDSDLNDETFPDPGHFEMT
jgi:hypothetical protein